MGGTCSCKSGICSYFQKCQAASKGDNFMNGSRFLKLVHDDWREAIAIVSLVIKLV